MTDKTEAKTPEPTMLYRPGEAVNPAAWNRQLDTLVVDAADDAALAEAKADGWLTVADLAKADAKAETAAPKAGK